MSASQADIVLNATDEAILEVVREDEKTRVEQGGLASGAFAPGPRILAELLLTQRGSSPKKLRRLQTKISAV